MSFSMPRVIPWLILFACTTVVAQSADNKLTFEVASVKLSTTPPPGDPCPPACTDGGPGTRYPERYAPFTTLRSLLFRAFDLIDAEQQISGPGWIDSEKYAINAKVPPGTSREQFQIMLRNLLIERFKLSVHHKTRTLPVYNLEISSRNGPKFKESPAIGTPTLMAQFASSGSAPISRWTARQQPISAFVRMLGLSTNVGRPVIDKTGLTGEYDFTFYYDVQIPGSLDHPVLTILDAIDQQLGLKLVDSKASFDLVVIDHAEKIPTEN